MKRNLIFDKNRNMTNDVKIADNTELIAELQRKTQQIEQLAAAVQAMQAKEATLQYREKILKEVRYMSTFTGQGDVTINSFISNVEYYINGVTDPALRQLMVRTIFYEKIQGEAKNIVINLPRPDDWESIKGTLKLRYKPDTEPTEIYRRITNLKINTVSELSIELQNIKYKTDELIVYQGSNACIDLSNVESILVNTAKEMCQGVLLDKIYEERDLGKIITIMQSRRFEDSCIREEFRKTKNNFVKDVKKLYNFNKNKNHHEDNGHLNDKFRNNHSYNKHFDSNFSDRQRQNYNGNFSNNNSGQFRKYFPNNNSGQFRRPNPNSGNYKENSGQYRHQQNFPRPSSAEPMEVDNIQKVNKENTEEVNNVNFFMN